MPPYGFVRARGRGGLVLRVAAPFLAGARESGAVVTTEMGLFLMLLSQLVSGTMGMEWVWERVI